jgi:hypothetical protein
VQKNNKEGPAEVDGKLSTGWTTSSLHEVVGSDGALMIALESLPARAKLASQELAKAGIQVRHFPATNGNDTSPEVLSQACRHVYSDNVTCPGQSGPGKFGVGCRNKMVQAIAHSHQRALQTALTRSNREWTAIFEDDAVPVIPAGADWNEEFRKAWQQLPAAAKVVRLGWCQFRSQAERFPEPRSTENGLFNWVQFTAGLEAGQTGTGVGGCTTGYMVHKSIIPSMLNVFPCCIGVDACMEMDFYAKQDPAILANLMVVGGDKYIADNGGDLPSMKFRGVVMQATKELGHTHSFEID